MGRPIKEGEQRTEIAYNTDICSLFHNSFLVIGIGSPLRTDDQAGLLACEELSSRGVNCIRCEYGLESCISEIVEYSPKTLIVLDAVIFNGGEPGDIIVATANSIDSDKLVLTTHSIPFSKSIELVRAMSNIDNIYIIGIYPKSINVGLEISHEIHIAIKHLVDAVIKCIKRKEEGRVLEK
ncbi:MAG: hydrogenase maturation protease [Desulfurococcaceae archaeon]